MVNSGVVSVPLLSPSLIIAALVVVALGANQIHNIIIGEKYYIAGRPLEVLQWAPEVRSLALETGSTTLMARKPHLAHYAGLEPVAYPQRVPGYLDFLDFAFNHQVDLIAVGSMERKVRGKTFILDFLDKAEGVSLGAVLDGLNVYYFDRSHGLAAASLDSTLRDLQGKLALAEGRPHEPGAAYERFSAGFDLASAYMTMAQWQDALNQFEYCANIINNNPGTVEMGDHDYLKVSMAFCYLNLDKPTLGLVLLGENLAELSPQSDAYLTGLRHFVLGRLYYELQRRDPARRHLRLAYDAYQEANHQKGMAEAQIYLREMTGSK